MTDTATRKPELLAECMLLLVALDDARNMHEAASLTAMTQPGASKMLKDIEEMLGVSLFERLRDAGWVDGVSRQLARATRALHDHHFAHNDLKWRNLLVNEQAELFLIDCPTGSFWWGPFLRYRVIKDLACLDKVASKVLTRSQRLRFFLQYRGRERLSSGDKRRVRQIVKFFEGRE